ncbi:HIT-like protein [Dendrothele bispora CBS 962.96]|uniref:HIT-like protein n=1 Tax=Dendrothele bispora (strain CBS 962.96) TaxID=1314807 RepID=A0A4S8M655_DENBC|nr:HIT-like protein [Dendrothele bispora CBS 962.96]
MSQPALHAFQLERILDEEPEKCRVTLLGTLPTTALSSLEDNLTHEHERVQTIIRIEKTAFSPSCPQTFFGKEALISNMKLVEHTDIYSWFQGWLATSRSEEVQPQGDVKINVICPATEVHIRKYSKQLSILVSETPELYKRITEPYISNFPPSRTQWVTEILSGRAEQEKILFSSPEFVILPDMKWDLHTVGSLYLVAIVRDPSLRSLRDLRGDLETGTSETKKRKLDTDSSAGETSQSAQSRSSDHISLLKSIRHQAYRITREKWGIGSGGLRMWIHYQPSYYHFHVHIVNANYEGAGMGMAVGQAHLLEDVIALLENNPTIFETMTLTYGLGEQHGLYESMRTAQEELQNYD